jgi:hypothetical protein
MRARSPPLYPLLQKRTLFLGKREPRQGSQHSTQLTTKKNKEKNKQGEITTSGVIRNDFNHCAHENLNA